MMENSKVYAARDADGKLYLYINAVDLKKDEYNQEWYDTGDKACIILLNSNLYPEIRWEDDYPVEGELTLNLNT